ncbi:MAG TPA: hypothetical protein VL485_04445 [Ktedonobacteraceae bacterium]|jgi:hypothetical protein|nr:hypothetical protein [Ktedonobacteraceae bacterium]
MITPIDELLTDDSQFRQWLMSNRAEIVGYVDEGEGCPLANWLFECTDQTYHVTRIYYGMTGCNTVLPSWARDFVHLLEMLPAQTAINGRDALELLDGILALELLDGILAYAY